jgi:type II secretory pathway pseudopilin PulG
MGLWGLKSANVEKKSAGFSVLELVLVVSLLALLLSFSFPLLSGFANRALLKNSASLLAQCLRLARVEALRRGGCVSVFLGKDFFKLYYPDGETVSFSLPQGVEVGYTSFPGQRLFFFPTGVPASGGSVTLESGGIRSRVLVTPVTARVRLE